jgi:hypothetical protein
VDPPPALPCPGTVQYNILDAQDPHRFKISTEGPGMGWSIVQRMWVFPAVLVREAVAMAALTQKPQECKCTNSHTRVSCVAAHGCAYVYAYVYLRGVACPEPSDAIVCMVWHGSRTWC